MFCSLANGMYFASILAIMILRQKMKFNVKSKIVGFEDVTEVELVKIDELFYSLRAPQKEGLSFTVVNPHLLREYNFDISDEVSELLDIKDEKDLMVYNILVIQNPLEESKVNFLAPLIFNKANNTMAQSLLEVNDEQNYGYSESLKKYL